MLELVKVECFGTFKLMKQVSQMCYLYTCIFYSIALAATLISQIRSAMSLSQRSLDLCDHQCFLSKAEEAS
jgi:hypothetical protein